VTTSNKRTALKNKVAAAQKRNADRSLGDYAREAADGATSFVKEHPITTVLGGLAIGALIAAVVPGPGRRLRRKASKRGAVMAGILAELASTYGAQLLDGASKAAREGQSRLADLGETVVDSAQRAQRETGSLADSAGDTARSIGKSAVRGLRDLRARMAH
jgi:ElaB/YqjD/DUF883 family membrane-anchored ribosome-binding protein